MTENTINTMNTINTTNIKIKTIPLYNLKDRNIENVPLDDAVNRVYYFTNRIPTEDEIKKFGIDDTVANIKKTLSMIDNYIPLYDVRTNHVYLIQKRNVYKRVVNHDYRFPDESIYNTVAKLQKKQFKKLAKYPELKNDPLFMRSYKRMREMILFMGQFDPIVAYDTYLNVFYKYSPEIGDNTFTCVRRSFIPHKGHLKPYYTKDEALKLSLNIGIIAIDDDKSYVDYKDRLTNDDFSDICSYIQIYDVSSEILIQHQNYIVENDLVGLVQYYTLQGSYFMNQYLRGMTKYEYRNSYLEENIAKIWRLVLDAPPFDNNYILYRFIGTDEFLKGVKIGDIYKDAGFMSTTRDPFYRNDLYKFGFILIKIKIPKHVKGVGLCLETLSHFPVEEEIILPPLTKLRLVAKDANCEYYHPDEIFVSDVKSRYEFEWVGNTDVTFPKRPELPKELATQTIDFLEIKNVKTMSLKDKINFIMKTYFDPMNRILCKIGDNTFYVVGEWYDSTGAYFDMYSLKISDGFSLYTIYKGYILFMIEIGDDNGQSFIKVNYYTKYSRHNRHELLGDDNFIKFISSIAYYFDIPNVVIYADYMSCDPIKVQSQSQKQLQSRVRKQSKSRIRKQSKSYLESNANLHLHMKKENEVKMIGGQKKQRTYIKATNNTINTTKNTNNDTNNDKKIDTLNNDKSNVVVDNDIDDLVESEVFTGGSYCFDFYQYFKYNKKRYYNNGILNADLQPMFSYHDLDVLKFTKPTTILRLNDRDEIYQFYKMNYILENSPEKDNLADFYIWMIEHKCYLMDIFIHKMDRFFRNENPFKKAMYVLDAMGYLYNHNYVRTYNRSIKMVIDEEHQLLDIPKNEYRIRR